MTQLLSFAQINDALDILTDSSFKPIGIVEPWQKISPRTPSSPLLRDWLLNTGSLTERLQACCRHFQVQLLGQDVAELTADEQFFLYGQFDQQSEDTQVREVILKGDDQSWVFARSLLPVSFLHNEMDELTRLGEQPLGKIIFNDARFQRLGFQLVECPPKGESMVKLNIKSQFSCWGRRSLFQFKHYHIMVAEIFLPNSPAYANYQDSL